MARLGTFVFAFLISVSAAIAQTPPPAPPATPPQVPVAPGSITGKVLLDGAPVHGAMVLIIGSPRTATTAEDGSYTLPGVAPGTYEVIAQREHLTTGRETVTVVAGLPSTVDFT